MNSQRERHFLAENGHLLLTYLASIKRSGFLRRNAPKNFEGFLPVLFKSEAIASQWITESEEHHVCGVR
jgi:hypothetical protein